MNLGTLFANIQLNTGAFISGLNTVMVATRTFSRQLGREFTATETSVYAASNARATAAARNTAAAARGFKDLGRIVSGIVIAQVFYRAVSAISETTSAVVEFTAQMEIAQKSFAHMFGSTDRATGYIEVMKDFAAVTEYTVQGTVDLSRRLNAMGFAANQTLGIMKILTDETAFLGGGEAKLERIQSTKMI